MQIQKLKDQLNLIQQLRVNGLNNQQTLNRMLLLHSGVLITWY